MIYCDGVSYRHGFTSRRLWIGFGHSGGRDLKILLNSRLNYFEIKVNLIYGFYIAIRR